MARIRAVISGIHFGQVCENVLHLKELDPPRTMQQIAADLDTGYVNAVRSRQSSNFVWTNILVQNLDDPLVAAFSLTISKQGQDFNSASISPVMAYVIKLSTNRAGRHGRGRIYVPAVHFNALDQGFFSAALQASFKTTVTDVLFAEYGLHNPPNQITLCVRERGPGVDEFHPVVAMQLRASPGVQRRRNMGVGI